jgi:protein involved in polysaccharide export with SLBB domain
MNTRVRILVALGVCLGGVSTRAQDPAQPAGAPSGTPAPASDRADYRLVPQDRLAYRVAQDPKGGGDESTTVNALGEVRFLISSGYRETVTVPAGGRTLAEVREDLTRKLSDYYVNPTVQLQLESRSARFGQVFFYGEAKGKVDLRPGEPRKLSETLLEVGSTDWADLERVKVHRLIEPGKDDRQTIVVNVKGILYPPKRGKPPEDLILQDGDRVEVPEDRIRFFN